MEKILIVGGGIEALFIAFMIKKNNPKSDITITTKNSDPRKAIMKNCDGATWSGMSPKHITCTEGYNRNVMCLNKRLLQKKVNTGGWLGKAEFSNEEKKWLIRRTLAQSFHGFNSKLLSFYKQYNTTSINIWHDLIFEYGELFCNTKIVYGVKRLCKRNCVNNLEFSLCIHSLAINILNYLEANGVFLQFESEIIWSSLLQQGAQSIILAVGAYDNQLLQYTEVANRIFAIGGGWLKGKSKEKKNMQMHQKKDLWQLNYTPIGNQKCVIGGGYAAVGFDVNSLCKEQMAALNKKNLLLAQKFCNTLKVMDKVCFRAFTDNDVPILVTQPISSRRRLIIVGGMNTGTTAAAPLTAEIVCHLLTNEKNFWLTRLNDFNEEWQYLLSIHRDMYMEHAVELESAIA